MFTEDGKKYNVFDVKMFYKNWYNFNLYKWNNFGEIEHVYSQNCLNKITEEI